MTLSLDIEPELQHDAERVLAELGVSPDTITTRLYKYMFSRSIVYQANCVFQMN
jgi:hypothetical protein